MTGNVSEISLIAAAVAVLSSPAFSQENSDENDATLYTEVIEIFGQKNSLDTATGSGFVIDEALLEQFEFDDIHRVLQSVPGVYIREEDGFGLRPNIGLRGATSERSGKVALMEDGILLAPAPYSAPAAYFFPLVSRMRQVEVFKGPSAIAYGPNTVGGAINFLSRNIGESKTGTIDIATGSNGYAKGHAFGSAEYDEWSALVEGIHIESDGFKELERGGNTGFSKNEALVKLAYTPSDDKYSQRVSFAFGYADEVSDETYLGLTDTDFEQNSVRRYAASQNDQLDWEHTQWQLSYYVEPTDTLTIFTQAYRRDFSRDWDRLNGFNSNRSLLTILASPDTGINALFMEVLRGDRDSLSTDETLVFTLNDRDFYSQGIQTKAIWTPAINNFDLSVESGLRVHQDEVERFHRNRYLVMTDRQLIWSGVNDDIITSNRESVTAIAGYVNGTFELGDLKLTLGTRLENINGDTDDFLTGTMASSSDTVVLPGVGLFYQLTSRLGVLFGVNKGFVPNSPDEGDDIDPEESWNYELGLRTKGKQWRAEAIGFFNDYANLKGTCTFSSGCLDNVDQEFNGGEVDIWGLEIGGAAEWQVDGLSFPVALAYTFTQSEFKSTFFSEFAQWGNVVVGDELPYLPEHLVNFRIGVVGDKWRLDANYKYSSAMQEAAGTGTELSGFETDSISQLDLAARFDWNSQLQLYAKVDNVTDNDAIVSRRPFGARPSKPREIIVGAKYHF